MRIAVSFVLSLILNIAIAQTSSSSPTQPNSSFNCDELTSHTKALRESTKSKKEKFSCILNLLKSALSDVLENSQSQNEDKDNVNSSKNVLEDKINCSNQKVPQMETERKNINGAVEPFNKIIDEITQDKTKDQINNTHNLEVPTMIPIFKQKPVIRNNYADSNPARPIKPEAMRSKSNPMISSPKFTIPCQRAVDVLDMSNVVIPREIENNNVQTVQPTMKPTTPVTRPILANQTPATLTVHSADPNESVAILFKPQALSLMQLYGNLLKKITITVLVPYHVSKMGQQ